MGSGYAKIFESIFEGSLRGQSDAILVFVNLCTHAGADGIADIHFRVIADETGLPVDRVKAATLYLEQPDPESRTPDEEGKRLVRMDVHRDWGWRIVNHEKYRLGGGQGDYVKELTRDRVRRFRLKRRVTGNASNVTVTLPHANASVPVPEGGEGGSVTPESTCVTGVDASVPSLQEVIEAGSITGVLEESCRKFFDHYQGNNLWLNRHGRLVDWRHLLVSWGVRDRAGNGAAPKRAFPETQLKELRDMIENHVANPNHSYVVKPTDAQREEFKGLKHKLRDLQRQIAGV